MRKRERAQILQEEGIKMEAAEREIREEEEKKREAAEREIREEEKRRKELNDLALKAVEKLAEKMSDSDMTFKLTIIVATIIILIINWCYKSKVDRMQEKYMISIQKKEELEKEIRRFKEGKGKGNQIVERRPK